MATLNANPIVYQTRQAAQSSRALSLLQRHAQLHQKQSGGGGEDEEEVEAWDDEEVFDLIRVINDPEHPLTLEQLNVAQLSLVKVDDSRSTVDLHFTPTIPHCSMATLIGLCVRVKLLRSLPKRFKVTIRITPGTHASEVDINKQLNDKERVAAALENQHLIQLVNKCITEEDDEDGVDHANRKAPLAA